MRAAVIHGGEIAIQSIPEPTPGAGQALLAPHFVGICGSDLHLLSGMREQAQQLGADGLPRIVPGHEFSAQVVDSVQTPQGLLRAGDRVVPIPFADGCAGPLTVGISPELTGGLAELTVVQADRCFRVPDGVPDDLAALTEPLSVGLHAARLANRHAGPNIVIGCGPVGLAVILALRAAGRGPIMACDFSAERRATAELLGADMVIDPATTSPYAHWDDLGFSAAPISPLLPREFAGAAKGVNIFECVGATGMLDQIIKQAPQHSHIIVVGVCSHVDHHTPVEAIVRELTLEYSFAYRPDEFLASMQLIERQPETVARLITSRRTLDATALAFDELAASPREIKILIDPRI